MNATLPNETVKAMMHPLTQEYLEGVLKARDPPPLIVIYFTAKWCKPCNGVNLGQVVTLRNDIQWMICDVDVNDYSLGFCQGRTIPSWLAIVRGKPLPMLSQSNTLEICRWVLALPKVDEPPKVSTKAVSQPPPPSPQTRFL